MDRGDAPLTADNRGIIAARQSVLIVMNLLLRLVLALAGWITLSLTGFPEGGNLAPGLSIFMALLSVMLWDGIVGRFEPRHTDEASTSGHPAQAFARSPEQR